MSEHVFQVPAKHVHFVGVGGIGMSGLAKILVEDGRSVSGSDLSLNRNTEQLREIGATIYEGHERPTRRFAGASSTRCRSSNGRCSWGRS